MSKKIALLLVGGKGTRLWPVSRENYPKQFVTFKNGLSLFQFSLQRVLSYFTASSIYIISSGSYKCTIFNQIEGLKGVRKSVKDILKNNLLLEPVGKNTAPAVMLSLKYLESKDLASDTDILYVFPADHVIEPISNVANKALNRKTSLSSQR